MLTHIAAALTSSDGDVIKFLQSFSEDDALQNLAAPAKFAVPPLTSKIVDLCGITTARQVFLKTDKPVQVTLTFSPPLPTPPPSPATVTIAVEKLLVLVTAVTAMTVINPNSGATPEGDANVEVLLVGS